MARCQFLEEIGYTYDVMKKQGFGWPIVQLNIKYVNPALFRQKNPIELKVVEYETCLRIDYVIFDAKTNQKINHCKYHPSSQSACKHEKCNYKRHHVGKSAVKTHPTFVSEENNNAIDDLRLRLVPKQRELRFF